jgi:hypothetical protein
MNLNIQTMAFEMVVSPAIKHGFQSPFAVALA